MTSDQKTLHREYTGAIASEGAPEDPQRDEEDTQREPIPLEGRLASARIEGLCRNLAGESMTEGVPTFEYGEFSDDLGGIAREIGWLVPRAKCKDGDGFLNPEEALHRKRRAGKYDDPEEARVAGSIAKELAVIWDGKQVQVPSALAINAIACAVWENPNLRPLAMQAACYWVRLRKVKFDAYGGDLL